MEQKSVGGDEQDREQMEMRSGEIDGFFTGAYLVQDGWGDTGYYTYNYIYTRGDRSDKTLGLDQPYWDTVDFY